MSIIEFRNVTKRYKINKQDVIAVDNISFTIRKGSFVAITGASGSGKSTILQLLSGIEPVSSGDIFINGKNITQLNNTQLATLRRDKIGIVFQNFYLEPNLSLRRNIELPAMFAKVPKSARPKRTEQLTSATDLSRQLDHRPAELSGGQVQRAAILRAIYNNPQIILADEPTSNIDQENAAIVLDILNDLKNNIGATIIVATHDERTLPYADKIIRIKEGRTI